MHYYTYIHAHTCIHTYTHTFILYIDAQVCTYKHAIFIYVQPWKLCEVVLHNYVTEVIGQKWCRFRECFEAKGSSVAHSLYYIVYIIQ